MKTASSRSIRYLVSLAAVTVLGLALGSAAATAGPFSGQNGKLAVVKNSVESGTFLGSLSPGGKFHQIYEAWDYNLAGANMSSSPDGSRVVLNVGWRPTQLAIARASGRGLRYIRTRGLDAYWPTWAGNGRIVFTGTGRRNRSATYTIKANGRGLHKLFNGHSFAASRDLKEFVSSSNPATGHYLELLDRNGKRVRILARSKQHYFSDPGFSPNGRWIVYERHPDPPGKWERVGDRLGNLYVVRRDGTHRRRLTGKLSDRFPTFSPDGRWIAFARFDRRGYFSNVAALRLSRPGRVHRITDTRKTLYEEIAWGRGR